MRNPNSRGLTEIEQEGLTPRATGYADPTSVVQLANRTLQGSRGGERATSRVDSEALGQMARGDSPVTGDALFLDPTLVRSNALADDGGDEDSEESPRHTAGASGGRPRTHARFFCHKDDTKTDHAGQCAGGVQVTHSQRGLLSL